MKYLNGVQIKVGDEVKLWDGCNGIVVVCLDAGDFCSDYPEDEWGYLKSGVLINSSMAGLIHYLQSGDSLELIKRGDC